MNALEGANCADLPGFVIDKYFGADLSRERFFGQVARAICSHCVVLEECRDLALSMPALPARGVIGGVSVTEVRYARRWRRYESGMTESVPKVARPPWLRLSDAAHMAEQRRLEADPDEPPTER